MQAMFIQGPDQRSYKIISSISINSACKIIARRRQQLAAKMQRGSGVYEHSLQIGYLERSHPSIDAPVETFEQPGPELHGDDGRNSERRPRGRSTRHSRRKALETALDSIRGLNGVARKPPTDVALPRRRHGEITAEITTTVRPRHSSQALQNVDRHGLR